MAQPTTSPAFSDSGTPADSPQPPPEMRYCISCGYNLTGLAGEHCPKCERPYNIHDPTTTTDRPPYADENYWLEAPRIAGYFALAVFLVGRIIINLATATAQTSLDEGFAGGYTDAGAPVMGGAIMYPLLLILVVTPWALVTVYLTLCALDDWINENLLLMSGVGMLVGGFILLASPLGLTGMMIGAMAGMFAGLVRRMRV